MVYEHDYDKEDLEKKFKNIEEIEFLFEYEIKSAWWTQYVPGVWLQGIISLYFSNKVIRKWKRYKLAKTIEDAQKEEKS